MILMQTAAVCAAIVIALAIAGVTPARGQHGKFDLIVLFSADRSRR